MSKIIKDSKGFTPEALVPEKIESPPVWGDITRKIDAYKRHVTQNPDTDDKGIKESSIEKGGHPPKDPAEDDFSVPVPKEDVVLTSEIKELQDIEEVPPQPSIDIEAIAEENFNMGVQAGIERLESDYGSTIRTLQSACEQLNDLRDTILENSMSELKELVLVLAEKIIRHSLSNQKDTIILTVEDAIRKAVKSDEFNIIVNPADLEIIKERSKDFINTISGLENIVVLGNPSVEQGGCIIESSNCTVDATLASQLEILADYVKNSE